VFNELFKEFTIQFNEDGTGVYNSFASQTLTWTYDNKSNILHIETMLYDDGMISIEGKVIDATITELDKEILWFTHTDDGDFIEQRYKKVE